MSYAPPSNNPANLDSLAGTFDLILDKFSQNMDGMLPAKVIAYSAGTPARVTVQPMISVVTTAGGIINRAQIASIPVFQMGGGGFIINFPLVAGDLGWIFASDRDISLFLNTFNESTPNTSRKHDFSSALFVPHVMRNYTISEEDAGAIVIQSLSGSVKVSIGASSVKISAPTVDIVSDTANVTADTVNLGGPGGAGVARIGDLVDSGSYRIVEGSSKVFAS